jgi:hypothetical protein
VNDDASAGVTILSGPAARFTTILGTSERLFPVVAPHLRCASAERAGAAVLAPYTRAAR